MPCTAPHSQRAAVPTRAPISPDITCMSEAQWIQQITSDMQSGTAASVAVAARFVELKDTSNPAFDRQYSFALQSIENMTRSAWELRAVHVYCQLYTNQGKKKGVPRNNIDNVTPRHKARHPLVNTCTQRNCHYLVCYSAV